MTNEITITNAAKVTAKGTHTGGSCKPVAKIDQLGRISIYTSGLDAAKENKMYASDLSRVINHRKFYKGNKFCFVDQLYENLDYISEKQHAVITESETKRAEQEARIAELEAKAKAYDAFLAAKQRHDEEIAEATEMLAHAQQAKIDLARRLHEAEAREVELIERLEALKAKEVTIG